MLRHANVLAGPVLSAILTWTVPPPQRDLDHITAPEDVLLALDGLGEIGEPGTVVEGTADRPLLLDTAHQLSLLSGIGEGEKHTSTWEKLGQIFSPLDSFVFPTHYFWTEEDLIADIGSHFPEDNTSRLPQDREEEEEGEVILLIKTTCPMSTKESSVGESNDGDETSRGFSSVDDMVIDDEMSISCLFTIESSPPPKNKNTTCIAQPRDHLASFVEQVDTSLRQLSTWVGYDMPHNLLSPWPLSEETSECFQDEGEDAVSTLEDVDTTESVGFTTQQEYLSSKTTATVVVDGVQCGGEHVVFITFPEEKLDSSPKVTEKNKTDSEFRRGSLYRVGLSYCGPVTASSDHYPRSWTETSNEDQRGPKMTGWFPLSPQEPQELKLSVDSSWFHSRSGEPTLKPMPMYPPGDPSDVHKAKHNQTLKQAFPSKLPQATPTQFVLEVDPKVIERMKIEAMYAGLLEEYEFFSQVSDAFTLLAALAFVLHLYAVVSFAFAPGMTAKLRGHNVMPAAAPGRRIGVDTSSISQMAKRILNFVVVVLKNALAEDIVLFYVGGMLWRVGRKVVPNRANSELRHHQPDQSPTTPPTTMAKISILPSSVPAYDCLFIVVLVIKCLHPATADSTLAGIALATVLVVCAPCIHVAAIVFLAGLRTLLRSQTRKPASLFVASVLGHEGEGTDLRSHCDKTNSTHSLHPSARGAETGAEETPEVARVTLTLSPPTTSTTPRRRLKFSPALSSRVNPSEDSGNRESSDGMELSPTSKYLRNWHRRRNKSSLGVVAQPRPSKNSHPIRPSDSPFPTHAFDFDTSIVGGLGSKESLSGVRDGSDSSTITSISDDKTVLLNCHRANKHERDLPFTVTLGRHNVDTPAGSTLDTTFVSSNAMANEGGTVSNDEKGGGYHQTIPSPPELYRMPPQARKDIPFEVPDDGVPQWSDSDEASPRGSYTGASGRSASSAAGSFAAELAAVANRFTGDDTTPKSREEDWGA